MGSQQRALVVEGLWAAGERASAYDAVLLLAAEDVTRWLLPLVESAKASGDHDRAIGLIVSRLAGLEPEHDAAVARRPASASGPTSSAR